jgi:hypothetical protein
MDTSKNLFKILATIALMFILPYLGALIAFDGKIPHSLFLYPAIVPQAKASFNIYIFVLISLIFVAFVLLYFFPKLYGFKKVEVQANVEVKKVKFPVWFWAGLIIWLLSLIFLWSKPSGVVWIYKFADILAWWGFTFMIDGYVYVRSGGRSLVSIRHRELVGIAFASMFGWMFFEYLNFFVNDNWYYPQGHQLPPAEFLCFSILASTAVFPISFEFYSLFNTFKSFKLKYSKGPKIIIPQWIKYTMFVLCLLIMFVISFYPNILFFTVWICPLVLLALLLDNLKIWSPFNPVKDGNWSPLLLIALSWVFAGLCVECWNYFSADHSTGAIITENTLYWAYSIPFVNVFHLFEMPLLGYMGYLPYGIYAGIWWIIFAYMLNIPTQFSENEHDNV